MEVVERFLTKVDALESGCWLWKSAIQNNGYGLFHLNKKAVLAHRAIYDMYYGDLDPKLTIDHLCRNRLCVNPQHLQQVTKKENTLRGFGHTAVNARKTHCKRGHELCKDNIRPCLNSRQCKICSNMLTRERRLNSK